jgi:hypothetical protein
VTQRNIEIVIGRLSTDEDFRRRFGEDPHGVLGELLDRGTHLNPVEMAALIATDATLWQLVSERLDPRLQKAGGQP